MRVPDMYKSHHLSDIVPCRYSVCSPQPCLLLNLHKMLSVYKLQNCSMIKIYMTSRESNNLYRT